MTPAEIAARLTPAQVRALSAYADNHERTPVYNDVSGVTADRLEGKGLLLIRRGVPPRKTYRSFAVITPLGREVLAELDKGETK